MITSLTTTSMRQFHILLLLADTIEYPQGCLTITRISMENDSLTLSSRLFCDLDPNVSCEEVAFEYSVYHQFRYKVQVKTNRTPTRVLCLVEEDRENISDIFYLYGYDVVSKAKQGFTKNPQLVFADLPLV